MGNTFWRHQKYPTHSTHWWYKITWDKNRNRKTRLNSRERERRSIQRHWYFYHFIFLKFATSLVHWQWIAVVRRSQSTHLFFCMPGLILCICHHFIKACLTFPGAYTVDHTSFKLKLSPKNTILRKILYLTQHIIQLNMDHGVLHLWRS